MKIFLQIIGVLCLLWSPLTVFADDVIIRTKADPMAPLVGQKVVLTIDVLAADGWATIPTLPLMEVPGAYLHRYESQGTRLNETVSGKSYSGQRYEILLFGSRAGEMVVQSFPVEVAVKTWGADAATKTTTMNTEPLTLSVSTPEGEGATIDLPVTAKMEARQSWSKEKKEYKPGDAVERRVTRRAEDISAMVLTPYEPSPIDGIRCYPGQPELNDSYNRGILAGTRVDSLSCLLEREGTFDLPEITFSYWNAKQDKRVDIVLPGISLKVVEGSAQNQTTAAVEVADGRQTTWLYLLLTTILVVTPVLLFRSNLTTYLKRQQQRRHDSEPFHFKKVNSTLKNGSKAEVLAAIMSWLDRLPGIEQPARLDQFVSQAGEAGFVDFLDDLLEQPEWAKGDRDTLHHYLQRARKTYLSKKGKALVRDRDLPRVGLSEKPNS